MFHQVPFDSGPPDLTELVASVREPPGYFQEVHQVQFEELVDDLDYFVIATLFAEGEFENTFSLRRHRGCPDPGTMLLVRLGTPMQMRSRLQRALDLLKLDHSSLTWVRYDLDWKL